MVVIRPVNLANESIITLRPKENYYERSTLIFDIQIDYLAMYFDTKQFSDALDFIKNQHYTTVFGITKDIHLNFMREFKLFLLLQIRSMS